MNRTHQLIYVLQFAILAGIIGSLLFSGLSLHQTIFAFLLVFFSELVLVYQQSKMKEQEIYYRKSCLFALGDLSAALIYSCYFLFFVTARLFKYSFEYNSFYLILLFTYTLVRKIYIFKNYTYEIK